MEVKSIRICAAFQRNTLFIRRISTAKIWNRHKFPWEITKSSSYLVLRKIYYLFVVLSSTRWLKPSNGSKHGVSIYYWQSSRMFRRRHDLRTIQHQVSLNSLQITGITVIRCPPWQVSSSKSCNLSSQTVAARFDGKILLHCKRTGNIININAYPAGECSCEYFLLHADPTKTISTNMHYLYL